MAKKDTNTSGILFENPDMEMIYRQLTRMETSLNEKITEVNNSIGSIPQPQPFPALSVEPPSPPPPIEVRLPPGLAKSSDLASMTAMMKSMNETLTATLQGISGLRKSIEDNVKVNYQELIEKSSQKAADASAKKVIDTLTPKIENSTTHALATGAFKSPGISPNDASAINTRLGRIEEGLERHDRERTYRRWIKYLGISHAILSLFLFGAIWWISKLEDERDELIKIEWLYRLKRVISSDAGFTNRIEKEILNGNDETREAWQSAIVERENTGIEFLYFQPHDDWQPKPTKPKEDEKTKTDTVPKVDLLPHQHKSRMTPGEIQAIKDMRANPHIPKDAKPPLPEGY